MIEYVKKIPKTALAIVSVLIVAGLIYGVTVAFRSNNSDEQALAKAILNTAKNDNINADITGSMDSKTAYLKISANGSLSKMSKDNMVAFGGAKLEYGSGIGDKKDSKEISGDIRSFFDKNTTYIKVGDLGVVLDTIDSQLSQAGANSNTIKSIIEKINNKWVKLKTAEGDENLSMQCLGGLYKNLISEEKYQEEFMRMYTKNKFYNVISKDKKDNKTSYSVEYSADLAEKFFKSLPETQMFKNTKKCRKSLDIFNSNNEQPLPDENKAKPNIQVIIDVDNKTNTLSKITFILAQPEANAKLVADINYNKKELPSEPKETTDMSTIQPELMQIVGSMRENAQKLQQNTTPTPIKGGLGAQPR